MLRSFLFAPATSPRKVAKALGSTADAVIVDLEDSVAIGEKAAARQGVIELLRRPRPRPVYVRINALSTSFSFADLTEIGRAAPDGIMLPKAESVADIGIADWMLGQIEHRAGLGGGSIALLPIIETAKGIAAAAAIASGAARVRRVAFGAVDLALDMDIELDDETGALAQARFAIALASRIAGREGPLDTAFINIGDPDGLRRAALGARRMGYAGKCCIHPAQIEIVNAAFSPSEAELARAGQVVAAFEEAERRGVAAVAVDGLMIDYPVVDRARRLLGAARPR